MSIGVIATFKASGTTMLRSLNNLFGFFCSYSAGDQLESSQSRFLGISFPDAWTIFILNPRNL
jgi:hypothetical protein